MTNSSNDESLRYAYGWSLLASHVVVWMYFAQTRALVSVTAVVEPYCWPYFETCWQWRLPSYGQTIVVMLCYLAAILAAAAAQWHRRTRPFALLLALLNIGLFLVVSLDYRLRANEFYMLFWTQAVFLCSSRLRWTMPVAIVSCYFWAGTLKLNLEWLSGAVLYKELWLIPPAWAPAACAYVVFLELVAIWGLLARRLSWFALAFIQVALFHLQSLSQIHWFYPALMTTILMWFVIDRLDGALEGRATLEALLRGRAPGAAYFTMAVFASLQVLPHLYAGDSTLTGQGRIFALHMFEARQECRVTAKTRSSSGVSTDVDLKDVNLPPRMICDPLVYFNRAQNLCRTKVAVDPGFDLRVTMLAKRRTDSDFTTIIDESNFCGGKHEYVILGNNRWIERPIGGTAVAPLAAPNEPASHRRPPGSE